MSNPGPMCRIWWRVVVGACLVPSFGGVCAAATAPAWLTGKEFHAALSRTVNVEWSGVPLRQGAEDLARAQRTAVFLDRRLDPGRRIDLKLEGVPLATAWREIAQCAGAGLSTLGPLVYLGPPERASQLRTLVALANEQAGRLPAAQAHRFLGPAPWQWEDFATPRELLADLSRRSRLHVGGTEKVPHDLWAGADLPPLSVVERVILVAVQFDLTLQISADGRTIELVPLPAEVILVRDYPAGPDPQATLQRFVSLAPQARYVLAGDRIQVRGLLEDHQRISGGEPDPFAVQPAALAEKLDPDRTRISKLTIQEIPVGQLLKELADRFELELKIDEAGLRRAGVSLEGRVTCVVENATVDELFRRIGQEAGLSCRRKGRILEIGPAAARPASQKSQPGAASSRPPARRADRPVPRGFAARCCL